MTQNGQSTIEIPQCNDLLPDASLRGTRPASALVRSLFQTMPSPIAALRGQVSALLTLPNRKVVGWPR